MTRENKALPESGFVMLWKFEGPVHTNLVGSTLVLNSSGLGRRVIYVHRPCTDKKYILTTQQTAIYSQYTN